MVGLDPVLARWVTREQTGLHDSRELEKDSIRIICLEKERSFGEHDVSARVSPTPFSSRAIASNVYATQYRSIGLN